MVNTFVTDLDLVVSASELDRQRLGKQRVEAMQILQALQHLRLFARLLGIDDFPKDINTPLEYRRQWIDTVIAYTKRSYEAVWVRSDNDIVCFPVGSVLPHKPASGNQLTYQQINGIIYAIEWKGKTAVWYGPIEQCVLPHHQLIGFGFKQHTAVRMWLGFEEYLKYYINVHIAEWVRRGYENNMQLYEVSNPVRPGWFDNPDVIRSFLANLIWKEIANGEDLRYVKNDKFINAWVQPQYIQQFKYLISQLPEQGIRRYRGAIKSYGWTGIVVPPYLLQFGTVQQPDYIWP
jgi:hypothetical protein